MQTPSTSLKLASLLVLAAASVSAIAQVPSSGATSTVVYASGDDLVIKSADGKLLNYSVPAGTKFGAGGKDVTIADLKPGTKLTKAVSTGADPMVVISVASVKGKVYGITPPNGVTLSLAEGTKDLTVPAGTTFMVDGKKLGASELKNGMMVEATVVTVDTTGTALTSAPPMTGAVLIAKGPSAAEEDLPAAGTHLPLFAVLGLGFMTLGFAFLSYRKPVNHL